MSLSLASLQYTKTIHTHTHPIQSSQNLYLQIETLTLRELKPRLVIGRVGYFLRASFVTKGGWLEKPGRATPRRNKNRDRAAA